MSLYGQEVHDLGRRLWPIHRSNTGDGTRETLRILREYLPDLRIHKVPSDTKVFDWTIPNEWIIRGAQLLGPDGNVVIDYANSNLHVAGYSIPIDEELSLEQLQAHLHSIPEQPDAIPYVTSYYNPTWGFCLAHSQREQLKEGTYRAVIDSRLEPGSMTYADLVLPGKVKDEIFISTSACHPSMANSELSRPVVSTGLASWLLNDPDHHYTYLASRNGNTRIDHIAKRVLNNRPNYVEYSYLGRGSDERTYSSAGVDLPFISIMRTRYGDYPAYHSSDDDLEHAVTPVGLQGGLDAVRDCINVIENEPVLTTLTYREPQLGKRGLYHSLLNGGTSHEVLLRTNILTYADGTYVVRELSENFGASTHKIRLLVDELLEHERVSETLQTSQAITWVLAIACGERWTKRRSSMACGGFDGQ